MRASCPLAPSAILSEWWPQSRIVLATGLALFGLALVIYYSQPQRPAPTAPIESIAVLPFKPLVAESRDPVLELGLADTLITRLSRLRHVILRPTSAVRQYTDLEQDPLAAGRELKVEAVLEGSLQRVGDRLRVTVRLLNVRDGSPLWAYQCDEQQCTDLFAVQDSISEEVAQALRLTLSGEEKERLIKRYTENTEAYQLYLKGRYFWNKYTAEGFKKAIEYFQQAIEKDPSYALAYAGLADAYIQLGVDVHSPPKEVMPKAKRAAVKALELDEALAEAHLSLGTYRLFYDWNWLEAERELKRAIELNPNNPDAHHFYGHYLQAMGRTDEAIVETKRGLELDPVSLIINTELGWAFYWARQYDQAIEQYRKTLKMDPSFVFASWGLAQAYVENEMYDEAIAELEKARTLSGGWSALLAELGYASAMSGQRVEAQRILHELKERARQEYIDPALIANIYIALGEKEQAFEWLEKAYRGRSPVWMIWLKVEPKFDRLRSDLRFTDLIRRIGLAP